MNLIEFQNKSSDVKQSRFWNALHLNDFLMLMLQEVSGSELSHGHFSLQVEHLIRHAWLLSVPRPLHNAPFDWIKI